MDSLIRDGKRVLIFVGLRSVAKEIADKLRDRGITAKLLIGQREGGMKQRLLRSRGEGAFPRL